MTEKAKPVAQATAQATPRATAKVSAKSGGRKPPPRRLGRGLDALLGAPVAIEPAVAASTASVPAPAASTPSTPPSTPSAPPVASVARPTTPSATPPVAPPARPSTRPPAKKTKPAAKAVPASPDPRPSRKPSRGEPSAGRAMQASPSPDILRLKVDEIQPAGSTQPRTKFDPQGLLALQESIRTHGVLQPVLVRPVADDGGGAGHRWQLIAGERRWRAAQAAGLAVIPALVRALDDAGALEVALVENIQRAALTPVEEATAFATLIEDFRLSQAEVATRVGKSRAHVTNMLRLLHLPSGVLGFVQDGKLGIAHALTLLQVEDRALMESAARAAVARGLTVRQLQKLLHRTGVAKAKRTPIKKAPDIWGEDTDSRQWLEEMALQGGYLLAEQLGAGAEVALEATAKNGALKATLHLKDAEQARRFYHVLLRFWHHLPPEDAQEVARTWAVAGRKSASQPLAEDLPTRVRDFLRLYVDVLSSHHWQGRPVRSAQQEQTSTRQEANQGASQKANPESNQDSNPKSNPESNQDSNQGINQRTNQQDKQS